MPRNKAQPAASTGAEAGAARLRGADAKNRPTRGTRRDVDAEVKTQLKPHVMPSTGSVHLVGDKIEVSDKPVEKTQLENLAFNEEKVLILVHETTDKTAEPIPYVINGGVRQAFLRGQKQWVRRKFVEVLARMKQVTYTQEKFRDSQDIEAYRNIPHVGLVYPFSMLEDPNPKGRAWLDGILAEG